MRFVSLLIIALCGVLFSSEPYPLWNGQESIANYAKRVNLLPTQSLDLGSGVNLDLVLIPAGKFIMGTPPPTPLDEVAFQKQIITGQALLVVSAVALLVMLAVVFIRAIRQKRWPQVSLGRLILMSIAASGCVLGALHWRHSILALEKAKSEYEVVQMRYREAYLNEKPAHPVVLTQPFYMGKFPVTEEQFRYLESGNSPKELRKELYKTTWNGAQGFCQKLSERTKQIIQLPTEAEWEYACRAGTTTRFHSGDIEPSLDLVAYRNGIIKYTGQMEANAFGLYGMHGSSWEWCQDWYDEKYYTKSPIENPQGPDLGVYRVIRGGSWGFEDGMHGRSAIRHYDEPDSRNGFRVVLRVPKL